MSNFNGVSWIYDFLVRIVFGKSLDNAQQKFLNAITPDAHILIIGGGTGRILSPIFNTYPNVHVDYVESSSSMIKRAKRKSKPHWDVDFKHQEDTALLESQHYDVVISGFFLDVFSESRLPRIVTDLKNSLKPNGILLVTDFHTDMYDWRWSRFLLRMMFLFFRVSANLESRKLLDFASHLKQAGLSLRAEARFYHTCVWTSLWAFSK